MAFLAVIVACTRGAPPTGPTAKCGAIDRAQTTGSLAPAILVPFAATCYPAPWQWNTTPHTGVDIAVDESGAIIAIADGRVVAGGRTQVGNEVLIDHPALGQRVGYEHLASVSVRVGDHVRRGQVLGTAVRPGYDLGFGMVLGAWIPHVHIEICGKPCRQTFMDPMRYITKCLSDAGAADIIYPVPC